jgi:hypothetical protein
MKWKSGPVPHQDTVLHEMEALQVGAPHQPVADVVEVHAVQRLHVRAQRAHVRGAERELWQGRGPAGVGGVGQGTIASCRCTQSRRKHFTGERVVVAL